MERFLVERARALAAVGSGNLDDRTVDSLRRLRERAESVKWRSTIRAFDRALEGLITPRASSHNVDSQ